MKRVKGNSEIEAEAERIRVEYEYFDSIKLDGWIWEFARRTKQYQELFEKFKKLSLSENIFLDDVLKLLLGYKDTPISPHCVNYDDLIADKDQYAYIEGVLVGESGNNPAPFLFYALPDYRIPHNVFTPLNQPGWRSRNPIIVRGLNAYAIIEPDMAEKYSFFLQNSDQLNVADVFKVLSPIGKPEQTVYVGISINAGDRDLRELIKQIKKHLTPRTKARRIVDKKWKYYLIVYDMVEKNHYKRPTIASILNEAFPKKRGLVFDESNIKRYYEQAVLLIDKGNYKEYLVYEL